MTVLTESKQFRKAFLGFLLSAHQGNNGWNIDRDGKDITIQAGNLGDFTADTSRHNTRPARSGGPVSYQEASSSDTGMDSSQGEGMQLDNIRRGAQNGERTSYSPDQCFLPWNISSPRELDRPRTCARRSWILTHTYKPEKPLLTLIS